MIEPWRSYLTQDQAADLRATEAYERFAKAVAAGAVKSQSYWRLEADTARLKINRLREGALQRMHAATRSVGGVPA